MGEKAMWTKIIWRGAAVLTAAFILTSAVIFWLPIFWRYVPDYVNQYVPDYVSRYIPGYDLGYVDTLGPFDSGSYNLTVRDLTKLSPDQQRHLFSLISDELREKTNAELFQMKAFDDVCVPKLVDCWGIESAKIKPFIDAVLSDRQMAVAIDVGFSSQRANFISAGSLLVSFVALIFTALAYRKRRVAKAESLVSRRHIR